MSPRARHSWTSAGVQRASSTASTRCRTSSTGWTAKGPSAAASSTRICNGRRRVRLRAPLQRPLPPRVPRRAAGVGQRRARADRRARGRARTAHRSARLPRRARHHVQLVRGAGADSRAVGQRACPGRGRRRRLGDSGTRVEPSARGRSSACATRSSSTSDGSTPTRGARSCSTIFIDYVESVATAPLDLVLDRQRRCCRFRRTPASAISASCPTRTSSTRWRPPKRWSCRRPTKACRWWRSKPGRWDGRCSPTPVATSWSGSASAAMPGSTMRMRASSAARSTLLLDDPSLAATLGEQRPRVLRAALQLAGHRTRSIWTCSSDLPTDAAARTAWSRCPAGSPGAPDGAVLPPAAGRRRRASRRGAVRRAPASRSRREIRVHHAALRRRHQRRRRSTPCRLLAEQVSARHDVDVLTTCARDPRTWKNDTPKGADRVRGVLVRRFAVSQPHDHERLRRSCRSACSPTGRDRAPRSSSGCAGSAHGHRA